MCDPVTLIMQQYLLYAASQQEDILKQLATGSLNSGRFYTLRDKEN